MFLTIFNSFYSSLSITFLNTIEMWSESLGSISLIMGRKFGETNKLGKEGLLHEDAGGTGYVTFYQIFTYHGLWKRMLLVDFQTYPNFRNVKMKKKKCIQIAKTSVLFKILSAAIGLMFYQYLLSWTRTFG